MSQNPVVRRAYVVRPRQELITRLLEANESEVMEFCGEPCVVMTEPLPFEGKLEGYRKLILGKCKEAYISNLFEFEPFCDLDQRYALLGDDPSLIATFDKWWTMEEVETLEIETTW